MHFFERRTPTTTTTTTDPSMFGIHFIWSVSTFCTPQLYIFKNLLTFRFVQLAKRTFYHHTINPFAKLQTDFYWTLFTTFPFSIIRRLLNTPSDHIKYTANLRGKISDLPKTVAICRSANTFSAIFLWNFQSGVFFCRKFNQKNGGNEKSVTIVAHYSYFLLHSIAIHTHSFTHFELNACLYSNNFNTMTKYKCLIATNVIMSDDETTNTNPNSVASTTIFAFAFKMLLL